MLDNNNTTINWYLSLFVITILEILLWLPNLDRVVLKIRTKSIACFIVQIAFLVYHLVFEHCIPTLPRLVLKKHVLHFVQLAFQF